MSGSSNAASLMPGKCMMVCVLGDCQYACGLCVSGSSNAVSSMLGK